MYNLLIVDDDPWMVEYLTRCIQWKEFGIQYVFEANSGEEAEEILEDHKVDIVISDVKMGEKDGLELLGDIKKNYPYIRVILLSGIDSAKNVREAFRMGVIDFLFKPVDPKVLSELIISTIRNIESEKENTAIQKVIEEKLRENQYLHEENAVVSLVKGTSVDWAYLPKWLGNDKNKKLYVFRGNILKIRERLREETKKYPNIVLGILNDELAVIGEEGEDLLKSASFGEETKIGISNAFAESEDAKRAYAEAKEALEYDFYDSVKRVFYVVNNPDNERIFCLLQNTTLFSNILLAGRYDKAKDVLNGIFKEIEVIRPSLTTLHTILLRLIDALYQMIDKSNQNPEQIFRGEYLLKSHYEKLQFNNINEMKEWMISCLDHCVESLESKGENSKRKVIEDIEKIIVNNLDKEISLDKIASKLYLNPSYLSRLFKENVGKSYTKYVMEKRIEKAKYLLKEENYKIYEIGELVGYENTKYFNKIFKELVGITPKEYREKVKIMDIMSE